MDRLFLLLVQVLTSVTQTQDGTEWHRYIWKFRPDSEAPDSQARYTEAYSFASHFATALGESGPILTPTFEFVSYHSFPTTF